MFLRSCAGAFALALLLPAAVAAAPGDSQIVIRNESLWTITQLYLSPVDEQSWGEDQLGEHVVATGESFRLHGVPCDIYDVRLVDEDDDVCIVGGVKLCADQDTWRITDEDLLTCQVETEE